MSLWYMTFSGLDDGLFIDQLDLLTYETEDNVVAIYPTCKNRINLFFQTLWKLKDNLKVIRRFTWQLNNDLFMSICPIRDEPEIRPLILNLHNKKEEITIKSLRNTIPCYQTLRKPTFTVLDFQRAVRILGNPQSKEYKELNLEDYVLIKAPIVLED